MHRAAIGAVKSRLSKAHLKVQSSGGREEQRQRRVERDLNICKGVELFCKDLSGSIEHLLELLKTFWKLMQDLNDEWLDEDDGFLRVHVWALKRGVDALAPPAQRQLQAIMKKVRRITERFRGFESEDFKAWDKAWIDKEHYERKLRELRTELTRWTQSGKDLTDEQLERLRRNEEKNSSAQDAYEAFHWQAQEYAAARKELKGALSDAVRTATCGWLIQAGAGICRAVQHAEAAQRGERHEHSPEAPASGTSEAPGASNAPLALMWVGTQEDGDEAEAFDPADPFKGEWHCEDLGEDATPSEDEAGASPTRGPGTRSPADTSAVNTDCHRASSKPSASAPVGEREAQESAAASRDSRRATGSAVVSSKASPTFGGPLPGGGFPPQPWPPWPPGGGSSSPEAFGDAPWPSGHVTTAWQGGASVAMPTAWPAAAAPESSAATHRQADARGSRASWPPTAVAAELEPSVVAAPAAWPQAASSSQDPSAAAAGQQQPGGGRAAWLADSASEHGLAALALVPHARGGNMATAAPASAALRPRPQAANPWADSAPATAAPDALGATHLPQPWPDAGV
eukprot:CAMPEP_0117597748 /NCGR_PEP_ID=MMETSP0784-20121206/75029_1 /TAXON_ID=39447 /ORGANISM="" /LENGTH=571 /DNA_ID=CAMNT_0005400153 /DNA_START=30 /DNA_END=1741 /DNA_ORIENTATION=+